MLIMSRPITFRHKKKRFHENDKIVLTIRNEGIDAISSLVNDDLSNIDMKKIKHYSLLHIAAYEGKEEVVQWLLEHGANVDNSNEYGETALQFATEEGHEGIAKILLARGANLYPTTREHDNYRSLLHIAVEGGYENIVKSLLDYGINVNILEFEEQTSLHVACEHGHEDIVKMLLDYGADINITDTDSCTVLHSAAKGGNEDIFKLLLKLGMDINATGKKEISILNVACKGGYHKIVKILLDSGVKVDVDFKDRYGLTLVHYAALGGNENVFKLVLDYAFNTNTSNINEESDLHPEIRRSYEEIVKTLFERVATESNQRKSNFDAGDTFLHSAATGGNENIVKLLLDSGINVNVANFDGDTALIKACNVERENLVKLLLNQGANPNIDNNNVRKSCNTALCQAISKGNENIVNLLLEHGANANFVKYGRSTLELAISIRRRNENVIKALIAYGANINFKNEWGNTHLHIAIKSGTSDNIIKLLLGLETDHNTMNSKKVSDSCQTNDKGLVKIPLQRGIGVDIRNNNGNTALHIASVMGNESAVKILLDCKSDIGLTNNKKNSALHFAARSGHEEIVKILTSHGAQVDIKDIWGNTPLMLSRKADIVKLLIELGADINTRDNKGDTIFVRAVDLNYSSSFLRSILHYGVDVNLFESILLTAIKGSWRHIRRTECTSDDFFESLKGTGKEIIELLIDHGANVQDKGVGRGFTLLSCAIEQEDEISVQLLLDYGVDINIEDNENRSIVHQALAFEWRPKTCAKILIRHIVKIKSAGLHVTEKILQDTDGNDELRTFKIECEEEIDKIKSADDEIPYWKILTSNLPSSTHFARNEYIIEALKSDELKVEYPIYSSVMKNQIRRGIWRSILLDKVKLFFGAVVKAEGNECLPVLPRLCVDEIFSYFSNRDFRNLIKVCDPSNDFNLDLCDIKI